MEYFSGSVATSRLVVEVGGPGQDTRLETRQGELVVLARALSKQHEAEREASFQEEVRRQEFQYHLARQECASTSRCPCTQPACAQSLISE